MSKRIKPPRLLATIVGVQPTMVELAGLVYARPWLSFTMPVQFEDADGSTKTVPLEFGFEIDPQKNERTLASAVMAAQQRLQQAIGSTEAQTQAREAYEQGKSLKRTRDDLADADLVISLIEEMNDKRDARLLALVSKDENGQTVWNFKAPDGSHINLTIELLQNNLLLAQRMHAALDEYDSPTQKSSEVAIKTTSENGTKDSTQKTPEVSLTESPTQSGLATNPTNEQMSTT